MTTPALIHLHIGQTKTATTTLQRWLSTNRAALAARGVLYPLPPGQSADPSPHRFVLDALNQGLQALVPAWQGLARQIDSSAARQVVISEELLWHLFSRAQPRRRQAIGQLQQVLRDHPVQIAVTLRRQDHWVESWHNQLVKTQTGPLAQLPLEVFVDRMEEQGLLDYEQLLADWADVFGDAALRVRVFDPGRLADGDPVTDFCRHILGLPDLAGFQPVDDGQPSLSHPSLVQALAFNRLPGAEARKASHQRWLRMADTAQTDRRRRLSPATANRLLARHGSANQRIAARFGLRAGPDAPPSLFDDWRPVDEATPVPPGEPLPSEMATLMAQLFIRQENQVGRLQRQLDELQAVAPRRGQGPA